MRFTDSIVPTHIGESMKFYVKRASNWSEDRPPIDGAEKVTVPTVERTFWEIEVESLDALLKLVRETDYGHWGEKLSPAIILEFNPVSSYSNPQGWRIVIYDSYYE